MNYERAWLDYEAGLSGESVQRRRIRSRWNRKPLSQTRRPVVRFPHSKPSCLHIDDIAEEKVLVNDRTSAYARLMASIGINAVVINNVNVDKAATLLITQKHFEPLKKQL